jgi:oligopeptide/dipeptide ABC transporter ATP-binding protein
MTDALLEVDRLEVVYHTRGHALTAVRGVSFQIAPGETVGVVGESGSGKTTIGRAILGLAPVKSGTIRFAGQDITHLQGRARRTLAKQLQVIFQDPYASLNPALKISGILAEPLRQHERVRGAEARQRIADLLARVGLDASAAERYPGSFSGGQRQRIAIARALMASPKLVICDEVVSALDLSVQANVLNLLRSLQDELGVSYLFIGHDLDVVRYMSRRIIVVYRGLVMEEGPARSIAQRPRHPYTRALLAAKLTPNPVAARQRRAVAVAAGSVDLSTPAAGCPFAPRCPLVTDICRAARPLLEAAPGGGLAACHLVPGPAGPPAPDPTAGRLEPFPTMSKEHTT